MENINNAIMNKHCIVRDSHRDVFAGTVAALEGNKALLTDARRLWYWDGAASVSQLALEGVKNPDNCKFTMAVPSVLLLDVIEIIPTTEEAQRIISEVPVWKR